MNTYLCYTPGEGDDFGADTVEADDAGSAAEIFAQDRDSGNGKGHSSSQEVMVCLQNGHQWLRYIVEAWEEITYHAEENEQL